MTPLYIIPMPVCYGAQLETTSEEVTEIMAVTGMCSSNHIVLAESSQHAIYGTLQRLSQLLFRLNRPLSCIDSKNIPYVYEQTSKSLEVCQEISLSEKDIVCFTERASFNFSTESKARFSNLLTTSKSTMIFAQSAFFNGSFKDIPSCIVINAVPLNSDELCSMVGAKKQELEKFHRCLFLEESIRAAIDYALKSKSIETPDQNALRILDRSAAHKSLIRDVLDPGSLEAVMKISREDLEASSSIPKSVAPITVEPAVTEPLPVISLPAPEAKTITALLREKLSTLEVNILAELVGQELAISALCQAMKRSAAGLNDPLQPIGSFLFVGPSGVGKSELAKSFARHAYENNLITLNMSEMPDKMDIKRLTGSPPGYIDSDKGGELSNALLKRPKSVVLVDEVEKGHPDCMDLFLRILDEGCFTSALGKEVNCREATFIFTSNLTIASIGKFFKPEFLGRLSKSIEFQPHNRTSMGHICNLELQKVCKRGRAQNKELIFMDNVKDFLIDRTVTSPLGARVLRDIIGDHILNPLADAILSAPESTKRFKLAAESLSDKISIQVMANSESDEPVASTI